MRVVAFDTNVILAALLTWHEHHSRAFPVLQGAVSGPDRLVLPLPALIEAYAVLTRLPAAQRVPPPEALAALSGTFEQRFQIVSLDGAEGWALLASAVTRSIAGGATYDAHIAACARKAGVSELVTFNERDFSRFDLGDMKLVVP